MTVRDDPISKQEFYELKRQVRELATQSPLRSASITEGRLRVGGSAILLIDSDGGVVIEGSLDGDGNITWTGAAEFTGTFTAKGTTRFEGDTTQVGPFHIEGATDLKGDMAVKAPGKVTIEGTNPIVLRQASGAAVIDIGSGQLFGFTGGIGMAAGTGTFYLIPTEAGWVVGSSSVKTTSTGTTIAGGIKIPAGVANLPTITGVVSNLYWDAATTQLKRIV